MDTQSEKLAKELEEISKKVDAIEETLTRMERKLGIDNEAEENKIEKVEIKKESSGIWYYLGY